MELSAFVNPLGQTFVLDVLWHYDNLLTECLGFGITLSLCCHHHFAIHFIPIILKNFYFRLPTKELVTDFLLHKFDLGTESSDLLPDPLKMNIFFKERFEDSKCLLFLVFNLTIAVKSKGASDEVSVVEFSISILSTPFLHSLLPKVRHNEIHIKTFESLLVCSLGLRVFLVNSNDEFSC